MEYAIIKPRRTVWNNSYITACMRNRMLDVNRTRAYEVALTAATETSFRRAVKGYCMTHHTGREDIKEYLKVLRHIPTECCQTINRNCRNISKECMRSLITKLFYCFDVQRTLHRNIICIGRCIVILFV